MKRNPFKFGSIIIRRLLQGELSGILKDQIPVNTKFRMDFFCK